MTPTPKPFQLGTISSGTLRPEDLMQAYASTLESLDANSLLPQQAYDLLGNIETSDNWDDNGDVDLMIDELYEALEASCPPFVYFGAHPGDGADFGFWPEWKL